MRDNDALIKLCTAELGAAVAAMFEVAEKKAALRGTTLVRAPVTGIRYDSWDEQSTEQAKRLSCAALGAKHAPPWAVPLLVSHIELDRERDPDPRIRLRHEFARSLRHHDWDYLRHPTFPLYAHSAMAHEHPADEIRPDRSLRVEFSPQPLVELVWWWGGPEGSSFLLWHSPEMIAGEKALEAFHEKLRRGASHDEARREGRRVYAATLHELSRPSD